MTEAAEYICMNYKLLSKITTEDWLDGLNGITSSMHMSMSKLQETGKDREA